MPKAIRKQYVYFIKARGMGGVKIGVSNSPRTRLWQMQSTAAVTLFLDGQVPGTRKDEGIIHDRFKHLRMYGEWFKLNIELSNFINECTALGRLPDHHYAYEQAKNKSRTKASRNPVFSKKSLLRARSFEKQRAKGKTLVTIGAAAGISYQRVRQILAALSVYDSLKHNGRA